MVKYIVGKVARPVGRPKGSKGPAKMRVITRRPGLMRLGGYRFTRYASSTVGTGTEISIPNTVFEYPTTFTFTLNNVRNASDFTNLFDTYKIEKVDLMLKLVQNPNAATTTNLPATYYPKLWYVFDSDDSSTMSIANMQEKQGAKYRVLEPNKIIKISCVPKWQKMIYKTLTSTGYGPGVGYLDCVDSTIPHYALKTVIDLPDDGASWQVDVQAKYHLSFKGPQ